MVRDIRAVETEQHWAHFEQAWTALLTYRYLGKLTPILDAGVDRETMPLRHDMRNSTGGVMAAPLCIACPEPFWRDDECVPAPVVMSYEILDAARDVRQVEVVRDVIHLGRTMGFSRSRIVDADDPDRLIAVSSGTGVSLGEAPPSFGAVDNPPIPVIDSPSLPPLHQVFGANKDGDGLWRLPVLRPELSSPHAALHLGPINVVLEAVAVEQATRSAGSDALQIESWTVMMERPGVIGPFRATGEVLSDRSDRVIATAVAVFRPVTDA